MHLLNWITGTGWKQISKDDLDFLVDGLPAFSEVLAEVHVDNFPTETTCPTTTLEEGK